MQPCPQSDLRWQPYHEPLHVTLARTGGIVIFGGAVLARWMGGPAHWPIAALLVFWVSFGGHWVELWFLNWLRPRLPIARAVQVGMRVGVWFIGGIVLAFGMALTARLLAGFRLVHWPSWWVAGLAFIGIELAIHFLLQLTGRGSFYNGRG